ncbi:MAG: hypothetical protein V3R99_09265 [Thermoguttaceae bacterium]
MFGSTPLFPARRRWIPVLLLAGLFAMAVRSSAEQASDVAVPRPGESRHQDLRDSVRRFQVTPTTPDFGVIQRRQPRTGQVDPLAVERMLTTVPYRSLNPERPGRQFEGRPLVPRELNRPDVRDALPDRLRTGQANPLVYEHAMTTQGRWDFSREPDPRTSRFALDRPAREVPSRFHTFNRPSLRPEIRQPRTYTPRPARVAYSRFNRAAEQWIPLEPPQPRRTAQMSTGLTFNHDHVAQNRRVPGRHVQPSRPTAGITGPDRPFRRPPRSVYP